MSEYKINEELLGVVLNYLATKPYAEVAKLISAIQNLEKVEPEKKPVKS